MRKPHFCLILLIPLLLVFGEEGPVFSLDDTSSLQCSGGIVVDGDTKYQVLEKCGEPTVVEESGSVWIYNFGPTELVYYITFTDDIVERIQTGDYGS